MSHAISAPHECKRSTALCAEALHYYANSGDLSTAAATANVLTALVDHGQPQESCPSHVADGWTPATGVTHFQAVSEYRTPSAAAIIELLDSGAMPVVIMRLTHQWWTVQNPWIINDGDLSGDLHAFVAVGHGQHEGDSILLIRNSWGEAWGDGGHAWLPARYVDAHIKNVIEVTEIQDG